MRRAAAFVSIILLVLLGFGISRAADTPTPSMAKVMAEAAEIEAAAANLPDSRWNADVVRELARSMGGLPDEVAAEGLWRAVSASPRVDTLSVFANALTAPSVNVRIVAVSILAGQRTEDARRLLMNTLALERNPDVVQTVIQGLAHLPRTRAVHGLMDVMFLPGASGMALDSAAEELRRLTRADIGNSPVDWRDWWLDNEHQYE